MDSNLKDTLIEFRNELRGVSGQLQFHETIPNPRKEESDTDKKSFIFIFIFFKGGIMSRSHVLVLLLCCLPLAGLCSLFIQSLTKPLILVTPN